MKIAIITETFPPIGASGISSAHYNLFRLFKGNGHHVKAFTFTDNTSNIKLLPDDPDVFHYGISSKLRRRIQLLVSKVYKYQRKLFYKTDTYLPAYQLIDIVTSNLASRKINKELSKFSPDVVILPDHGVPGFSIRKIKGARYIHISHHNPIRFINNPFFGFQSTYDARLAVKIERKSLAKLDAVICPSNYMKDVFISTFGNKIPVSVLPNLIDNKFIESIEAVSVNKKIDLDPGFPIVYIPSGGSSVKGERFVIEIIRRLAVRYNYKIGFYISGGLSSIQTEELEILNRYAKLVFSPGIVDNIANIGFIKSCKICVSPTLIESFGMANLEANFCNVPVVTFDVGGNKELIEDGQNGFVVPFMDMEAMMLKTCDILDGKIHLEPLAYANSKFSITATEGKYNEFLTTIV